MGIVQNQKTIGSRRENTRIAAKNPFVRATVLISSLAVLGAGCTVESLGAVPQEKEPVSETPITSYVSQWLSLHPNVANAIKWQNTPADNANVYTPPSEGNKVAWQNWTEGQKNDLDQAYTEAYAWFAQGALGGPPADSQGLTGQPVNVNPNVACDYCTPITSVTPSYMWKLYVSHVGFSLAAEITRQVPWSIADYSEESLRYLFDSTAMGWDIFDSVGNFYSMGTYYARVPANRSDNLPETPFAPPMWVYSFLKESNLIGPSRIETIGNTLEWMRQNMVHFNGDITYQNYEAVWQYRGYSPLSKIVYGTIDKKSPGLGVRHWTAGCQGSVGFLHEVLRVANIPVQPVWVCGHALPYFLTEEMYLDHGDDPYDTNVKSSKVPILSLLINEATYQSWFSPDTKVNVLDETSPACLNLGRRASEIAAIQGVHGFSIAPLRYSSMRGIY